MSNWVPVGKHTGFNCNDCGSYVKHESMKVGAEADCTRPSCLKKKSEAYYAALNGICECGWVEADAGTIGVYCTNPDCPVERRIRQSVTWPIRVMGVSRVADNDKVLMISFNRKPTDDKIREIHEKLKK